MKASRACERWIAGCRRECPDWMLIVNQRHPAGLLRRYSREPAVA